MTCPICVSIDDSSLVAGLRAGALVLIVVATLVMILAARFAWRLWTFERRASANSGRGTASTIQH